MKRLEIEPQLIFDKGAKMVFFVCLFLMGLGFELRALPEQSRCSTA
jgi:hypothetical protein